MFSFFRGSPAPSPTPEEPLTIIGDDIHVLPVDDSGLPLFLPTVLSRICAGCSEVGIFRTCGNRRTIDELARAGLNPLKFVVPDSAFVPDLTSFLKDWLRSLPEPILTPRAVNDHLSDSAESVWEVLRWLDPLNRKCIARIFAMLRTVLAHQEENKMNIENLAICFAVSFTQMNEGLSRELDFQFFFESAVQKLNAAGTDFDVFAD